MSSYAMHAGLDNGFSLMTDCPAVTHFMLNSFSLFNFTSVILWGVVLGWGGVEGHRHSCIVQESGGPYLL